jgi:predicted HicB family RNase H-like nuclease
MFLKMFKRNQMNSNPHKMPHHLNLKLEEELRRRLIAEAARSERSLTKEIVYRLRKSIEAQEEAAA